MFKRETGARRRPDFSGKHAMRPRRGACTYYDMARSVRCALSAIPRKRGRLAAHSGIRVRDARQPDRGARTPGRRREASSDVANAIVQLTNAERSNAGLRRCAPPAA